MDFLSNIPAARGFYCESNLWRGNAHGELVAGNPAGTLHFITDKIHLWRAFLFLGGGDPLSISSCAKQAEMALGRASVLSGFLHLYLLLYWLPFCPDDLLSLSKKIKLIDCSSYSFVRRNGRHPLLRLSRNRSEERRVGKECRSRWS